MLAHTPFSRVRTAACDRAFGRAVGILAPLSVLVACDAQRTITSEAAQYTLAVRVQLPASLSAVGQSLGWPSGNIPGARVIAVRRSTDSSEPAVADTAVSDAQGIARFLTLTRGSYALRLDRTFTSDERARARIGNAGRRGRAGEHGRRHTG